MAGQLLVLGGDLDGAIKRFRAVADNHPENDKLAPEALYWQGDAQIKIGDRQAAIMTFRLLKQKYPDSKWAMFGQSVLDSETGEPLSPDQAGGADRTEGESGK